MRESPLLRSACDHLVAATKEVRVRSREVSEASGIVASRRRPGWFWLHNDSGDVARLFGVDPRGRVQVVSVTGARAVDWEDLAPDRTSAGDGLWLADIGDNLAQRPTVVLYRIPEPGPDTRSVAAASLTLQYPDGPHNAESLLRDPADGTLVILTKDAGTARIYTFDPPAAGGGTGRLSAAGRFEPGSQAGATVTGADVSPDRSMVAVRTYGAVWLYRLRAGQAIADALRSTSCEAPHAAEVQGEALGFLPDSRGYATVSEGPLPVITQFGEPPA